MGSLPSTVLLRRFYLRLAELGYPSAQVAPEQQIGVLSGYSSAQWLWSSEQQCFRRHSGAQVALEQRTSALSEVYWCPSGSGATSGSGTANSSVFGGIPVPTNGSGAASSSVFGGVPAPKWLWSSEQQCFRRYSGAHVAPEQRTAVFSEVFRCPSGSGAANSSVFAVFSSPSGSAAASPEELRELRSIQARREILV